MHSSGSGDTPSQLACCSAVSSQRPMPSSCARQPTPYEADEYRAEALALCASEGQDRAAFRALLDAMVRGDDLSVGGGGGGDGVGRPPDQDGGGGGAAGAGLKTIMSSKSMLGD